MKRCIITIITAAVLFIIAAPVFAFAEDIPSAEKEVYSQLDDILEDSDIGCDTAEISSFSFKELIETLKNRTEAEASAPLKLLGGLLTVIAFTAVLKCIGGIYFKTASELYSTVSVLLASSATAVPVMELFGESVDSVKKCGSFIAVFIPVFSGITAASGGISTAGAYDAAVLVASELFVQLTSGLLIPMLSIVIMLSVVGSVFKDIDISSIASSVKKIITWLMTLSMTVFTAFLTLKCTLTGKADGISSKAARFVISGAVPIVGSAVNDAYSTVRSSFDMIRGTVGVTGCIGAALIILPPLIRILVLRIVLCIGSAAAELFSTESINKLLKAFDSGLAIAQSILICYIVMFVLSTAIILQTVG